MDGFQQARSAMVDCQIRTNGVINDKVLDAFETVPREKFVPDSLHGAAYTDKPIKLGEGRVLLDPMVHARLLEAVSPKSHETVLDIGSASGYSAAILSSLVSTVISLESRQSIVDKAEKTLSSMSVDNVVYVKGKLAQGYAEQAPFDIIIFNGAVSHVPEDVLDQLSPNGRLIAVVQETYDSVGRAILFQRSEGGRISQKTLFDASLPFVQGLAPCEKFHF